MRRIRPFCRHEDIQHYLWFNSIAHPGSGYAFDCDPQGKLHPLTESQARSYAHVCSCGDYRAPTLEWSANRWIDWGSVECPTCHAEHDLTSGDSACDCGQLFNAAGQALLPREQWED